MVAEVCGICGWGHAKKYGFEGGGGQPKNMVCKGRVTQKIILPLSLIVTASVIM